MKLPFVLIALLVVLLALDTTPAAAQRCVQRRWQCNRYGGVRRVCRIRRCARWRCAGRGRGRGRGRRNRGRRNRGRRNCRCRQYRNRRGFLCRRDTIFRPPPPPPVPEEPDDFAPGFCQEQCFPRFWQANRACNRELCFVRRCPGTTQWKCTAGAVPEIPGPQVCYGGCQQNRLRQRRCNASFCVLQRCGRPFPARFSCVPKVVTTLPPTTTTGTTRMGDTTQATTRPVVCPSLCVTGANGRNAFLSVLPSCRNPGCKLVFCKVAERTNTFGYACVGRNTPGTSVLETPSVTQTLMPTMSTTTTTTTTASTTATTTTSTTASTTATTTTSTTGSTTASTTASTTTSTTASTTASTTTSTTTSTTASTASTTTTTTLPLGVVSPTEWDRCTITRGGSRNGQNQRPAPNGNPINVDVTITNAGVINLACKQSEVTVSCSTDGSIVVSINNNAQADVLDVNTIYPTGAIFAYDRSVFTAPCVLATFPRSANAGQSDEAQRALRERAANVQDVFLEIQAVSGTPRRAVLRGKRVSALAMFSSARIFNVETTSRTVSESSYEQSMSMAREAPAVRQLFPLNDDTFSAQISSDGAIASFNGRLDNEGNQIRTIDVQVTGNGANVNTRYTVRRRYDVQYTLGITNAGDSAIRRTNEPLALSTIRTGFPDVNVTPQNNPPNCCNLPALRFEEFFEVRPFLSVGSGAGGEISAVGYNYRLVYPQQDLTITAIGPIANPVVSLTPVAVSAPTTSTLTATSAVTINPTTPAAFNFDIDVGMTPSLSLFLPSVVASLQQKATIQFDTRSAAETGVPAGETAASNNGACAAAHNLRINTVEELVDSQFVSLAGGDVQGAVGGRTLAIPGMNSPAKDFVRNDCFFP